MFEGFRLTTIDTGEVDIRLRMAAAGRRCCCCTGIPQTHVMWHKIAPRLAQDFTVVCAGPARLRRQQPSRRPPDHEPYSKRAMARDQVAVMRQLGFERFFVAGHDRGGRVAYRMALDHPDARREARRAGHRADRRAFRRAEWRFGMGYWHWFFLAQRASAARAHDRRRPRWLLPVPRHDATSSTPEAFADYLRCVARPGDDPRHVRGLSRGGDVDFQQDQADRGTRKIECPPLVLWGNRGRDSELV